MSKKTKDDKNKIGNKKKSFIVSKKELKIDLEEIQRDIKKAYESVKKAIPQAIKNAEIKKFGNASHIILPKEFAGKKATVLIR